jgi:hypothetical protein
MKNQQLVVNLIVSLGCIYLSIYCIFFNKRMVCATIKSYESYINLLKNYPWIVTVVGVIAGLIGIPMLISVILALL